MQSIRPAAVAGMFYPRDAAVLGEQVRAYVAAAEPAGPVARPKVLIVPHAGYVYSGPVAGSAYALLAGSPPIRRVVLVGPAHRVALAGIAAPAAHGFETPLGRVAIDTEALDKLPQVARDDRPHQHEHSLEVQLPFLQSVLEGPFTLLPLLVGRCEPELLAEVLDRVWGGPETLIVVSTDLSHHLGYDDACAADRMTARRIAALATDVDPHEACGARALNGALLAARRHGLTARLLDLRNSGDTAGSRERVVGYAALALSAPADAAGTQDEALGQALLARARNAIAATLGAPLEPELPHPALERRGCTFVTLRDAAGELRGCVGGLHAETTIDKDVRRHARAAAFDDARFSPVTRAEWPGLKVEVSLLDPPEPLPPTAGRAEALALLRPGVDGVVLECQGRHATFLPQVWEQLPDRDAFIDALLRKAGLPAGGWPAGLRLQRYRVRKFEAHDEA